MNIVESKSDEQLLADHIQGATGAFDQLVARYADELYGFLCRFVADKSAADDLIQDAFMQVHLASRMFDPSRSFRPWLYTIAANKARDHLRSRGRRQHYSLDASSGEDGPTMSQSVPADGPTLSETAETQEQNEAVRELVDQMPDHLRLILTLGYFQQLPYADIAQVLEIPIGTVKSRLHSAVNHFGKLWRRRMEGESEADV